MPAETVDLFRKAFDAMVKDPEFIADAEKRGADVMPMSGQALATYVKSIVETPPAIVKKTREVIGVK